MKNFRTLVMIGISILIFGCSNSKNDGVANSNLSFFEQVEQIPDSFVVGDVKVYNLFKYQILAHQNNSYDSLMIVNRVYKRHIKIWNELYAVLFDKSMFSTETGMINWNQNIYREKKDSIESRVNKLIKSGFNEKLYAALRGIKELTGRSPKNIRLSIILSPFEGIGFGGMENDAFILDLLDSNFDVVNMVEEGISHELNHFIYDPTRINDPNKDTPLRLTIDEGFACYYSYKYFNGTITKAQAVEQMSEADWKWYIAHEKDIYKKCEPYFFYQGDEDPLRQLNKEVNAPKTLFYWLGFRIVESYVQKHGQESWLDIYELPVKEVLDKSGYKNYIENL